MRNIKSQTEDPSSFKEISSLIKGKTIMGALDVGNEFQLQLSNDYMLKIS